MKEGKIIKISGPLVVASGMAGAKIYEVVKVSKLGLIGEIIELRGEEASIQVYEETAGLRPGEPVSRLGQPLSIELGPGLIGSIYDGVQRPLELIARRAGSFITRGIEVPPLDEAKKWPFKPLKKKGDQVSSGDILGEVQETALLLHKIMVPPDMGEAEVVSLEKGEFSLRDPVAQLKLKDGREREVKMSQTWPVRQPRPVAKKLLPTEPLVTGQRVIDTFFPVAKGGTASIPGPFGSGKTIVLHQLSKWAAADVIVFVGCGERGNEMTDVLIEFPELKDPKSGRPLLERTVLIANTSNMPVAAREASVYTGITMAEYFRDMGYSVALMADSTSRWAEALREISARLEEMPGEEGYPAYLASRLAAFYERAGQVECQGSEPKKRQGSLSVIGAISPPGGDLSEPVTQNTLRTTKVFWSLEDKLAYRRHFPAINWLNSYSLYLKDLTPYFKGELGKDFIEAREEAMRLLLEEARLEEIVRLVGFEALSGREKLVLEIAKAIREDFLMQNAFEDYDTYTSMRKQALMLKAIISFYRKGQAMLEAQKDVQEIFSLPEKKELPELKRCSEEEVEKYLERLKA